MNRLLRGLLIAISLLTIIPVPLPQNPSYAQVAKARFWLPVVGIVLGALLAALTAGMIRVGAPLAGSFLILALWLIVTGGLHFDGLCDLCDGLPLQGTEDERLEVMKDPHTGAFAIAGGGLLLLGKFAALADLLVNPEKSIWAPWTVAVAVAFARCLALCMAAGADYPRPSGTGKALILSTKWEEAGSLAVLTAFLMMVAIPTKAIGTAVIIFLPAIAVVMGLRWLCHQRLGGVTGDCLGAGIELAELSVLLTAAFII